MIMSPEDLRQLAQLEAAATAVDVTPTAVDDIMQVLRVDWDRDGETRRELYVSFRGVAVLSMHVAAIAQAHAACPEFSLRCSTCRTVRAAVAYALAAVRFQREVSR